MGIEVVCTSDWEPKHASENQPLDFDWHDYLASKWSEGKPYAQSARIRSIREESTGFEYEATTAGVSGRRRPNFPGVLGATVADGSVVWTARAISEASFAATIQDSDFSADGLVLSAQSDTDKVHTIFAAGGTSGSKYKVRNIVTLSTGELKEQVAILPVED